jgi:predicted CXXCH cytochrome family protein
MPSDFREPKTLSSWIELDYFRRRRLFRGWSLWLLGALLGSLLFLGASTLATGYRTFQAGPLSRAHALFNDDCGQCHQDQGATLARLFRGDRAGSIPDSACLKCHEAAHHNDHAPRDRCVSCHKEHRGHVPLVGIDDRQCTHCHADLKRDDGSPPGAPYGSTEPFARSVTAFTRGAHPEFRRWSGGGEADPGTLKFNHAVHLAERGVMTVNQEQAELQRAELKKKGIDPSSRRPPWTLKHLQCADCHTMDDEGRYMQPISYEKHCRQCHPLGVQVVGPWTAPELKEKVWAFGRRPLPHPTGGEKSDVVLADLRDRLTRFIASKDNDAFLSVEKDPPRPIDRLPAAGAAELRREKAFAWVDRYLRQTAGVLFNSAGGCGYCHAVSKPADMEALTGPEVKPANVSRRWWEHASFKHAPHRMLACTECHDAKNSSKTSDVLLPGQSTCLKCHDTKASASARADCVECHVYHDPRQQRAARERGTLRIDRP